MSRLTKIIKVWKEESGHENYPIQFKYDHDTGVLTIYTPYVGILIGRSGRHVDKYTEILKEEQYNFTSISFVSTDGFIA